MTAPLRKSMAGGGERAEPVFAARDTSPLCGCVYHPGHAGCRIWCEWDASAIEADFARMRAHGLQAVRFFIIWRDFEPRPGQYEPVAFARLRDLVEIAAEAGLWCLPAVLTIFMNGELLDLPWRGERDLWRDPLMCERARAFAARVAEELRDAANVFAYDIGDEIVNVDPATSGSLTRVEAGAWQGMLAQAIREQDPGARVLQGLDASAVFGGHAFGVDNARALDLHGLHTFPNWPPVPLDGVADPLASLLPGFLVRFAAPFGSTVLDELGSYGASAELTAGHLCAAGASALAAGARSLFAWCWQDITSTAPPYDARPHERIAGMLDAVGAPKPALQALEQLVGLAHQLGDAPVSRVCPTAILIPHGWRDAPRAYLESGSPWACAALGAYLLLVQEKQPVEFVLEPAPHTRLLLCPGVAQLTDGEAATLRRFVEDGGHLWCSSWSSPGVAAIEDLLGVSARDFTIRQEPRASLSWEGRDLPIDWTPLGDPPRWPIWDTATAAVEAWLADGSPAVSSRRCDQGCVWLAQFPLELQPFSADSRVRGAPWSLIYRELARVAGVGRDIVCESPWIEARIVGPVERERLLLVNHEYSPADVLISVECRGRRHSLRAELAGKQFVTRELPMD